ncbi:Transcription termination factor 2, partial [Eumeta japonica]
MLQLISIHLLRYKENQEKRVIVIESDDEEDEVEKRALSPCTRMSITGIRPADLTDDSLSEIDYSDTEQHQQSFNHTESKSELSRITEASSDIKSEVEEDKSSIRQSCSEESAAEIQSSGVSEQCEASSASPAQENILSPPKSIKKDTSIVNSPALGGRYSTHFADAIKEKFSSTIYRAPEMDSSNESDILIVDHKENLIEITSSESDDDKENNETTPRVKSKSINLFQPKISAALGNVPNLKKFSTPKSKPKVELKPVSQEYYDKEQLQQQRKAVFNNKAPDWDELSAAVNQIQPKHTGKQGLATFNNQKVLTVDRLK